MAEETQSLKQRTKSEKPSTGSATIKDSTSTKKTKLKFDDKPTKTKPYRSWSRSVMTIAVVIIVYFISNKNKEKTFARQRETIPLRSQFFDCSDSYLNEINEFPSCVPKSCGRFVMDSLVSNDEVKLLLNLALSGFALGGSSGGASILDLHSGALSKGTEFVNIYKLPQAKQIFRADALNVYQEIKTRISHAISERFNIDQKSMYLTHPTFFSRITNATAKTMHDEYWHPHVDKETYTSFHYTSLLYLSDFNKDFTGGRFVFIDGEDGKNSSVSMVEPKRGRISAFSSGKENYHNVEKVEAGVRYAITISFTCNQKYAISDPKQLQLENP